MEAGDHFGLLISRPWTPDQTREKNCIQLSEVDIRIQRPERCSWRVRYRSHVCTRSGAFFPSRATTSLDDIFARRGVGPLSTSPPCQCRPSSQSDRVVNPPMILARDARYSSLLLLSSIVFPVQQLKDPTAKSSRYANIGSRQLRRAHERVARTREAAV